VYRSVAEKRRIVELTLLPGASVSRVAQAEGVNSHQVFDWRRAYCKGRLGVKEQRSCALLPVVLSTPEAGAGSGTGTSLAVANSSDASVSPVAPARSSTGSIHIELPGRAAIRVENGVNATLLRAVLTTLASIGRLQGGPEEIPRP
jgi:transposase